MVLSLAHDPLAPHLDDIFDLFDFNEGLCVRRTAVVGGLFECREALEKFWMGHTHKDLTDQYAEQQREDVEYRREWCEKIGQGFQLPDYSQLSQPKHKAVISRKAT
jgi:hypothetical protein